MGGGAPGADVMTYRSGVPEKAAHAPSVPQDGGGHQQRDGVRRGGGGREARPPRHPRGGLRGERAAPRPGGGTGRGKGGAALRQPGPSPARRHLRRGRGLAGGRCLRERGRRGRLPLTARPAGLWGCRPRQGGGAAAPSPPLPRVARAGFVPRARPGPALPYPTRGRPAVSA